MKIFGVVNFKAQSRKRRLAFIFKDQLPDRKRTNSLDLINEIAKSYLIEPVFGRQCYRQHGNSSCWSAGRAIIFYIYMLSHATTWLEHVKSWYFMTPLTELEPISGIVRCRDEPSRMASRLPPVLLIPQAMISHGVYDDMNRHGWRDYKWQCSR